MRKKLYDEFVAECDSSCMDMYIAWLEERVFALDAKVEKFTANNTASEQLKCSCGATLSIKCKFCESSEQFQRSQGSL